MPLHEGHNPFRKSYNLNGFVSLGLLSLMTFTTAGIISPDFSTITVSPILMSFRAISSSLWRVALDTVVPDMNIGSNSATGVSTPVLPTWTVTVFNIVCPCSGRYLYAHAHFGKREV